MQPMLDTSNLPRIPEWKKAGEFTDIIYEKAEGIAKITINRPEVRNAFRPQTVATWRPRWPTARDDEDVGVVILSRGGRAARSAPGATRRFAAPAATSVRTACRA